MSGPLAHGGGAVGGTPGSYVGAALYDVEPAHLPAVLALVVVPVAVLLVHRGHALPLPWAARLRALPVERRVVVWALLTSALVHLLLVPTHLDSLWGAAFGLDALLLGAAAHRLVGGRRRAAAVAGAALAASLLGLLAGLAAGTAPDQVTMATKLVEVAGLVALWSPVTARRRRRVLVPPATAALVAPVVLGVWALGLAPAPAAAGPHGGAHASLGTAMPGGLPDREPTLQEQAAADRLFDAVVDAVGRYEDPRAAVAAGFAAQDVRGSSFHADHARWTKDGRVLDPQRPETLVYAVRDDGTPVLLGVMFQAEGLRAAGPAVGGPATVWHAHEQVCFGLLPPSLAGLTSPLGVCPAGAVTVPLTNEMMHVWTVPGAPSRFGDLPEDWLDAYLATPSRAG